MSSKFNFLIFSFLFLFPLYTFGNQISLGFNSPSLEKIIQFRSKINFKKLPVTDLSFNSVFQKLKSNEICIGILPTDFTYQYLLFGHSGEIKGKFSGDDILEVDLNNSKSNYAGLTMGGYVELRAAELKKNKLVNMPQQRINDIISGKISDSRLSKVFIYSHEVSTTIKSTFKIKKISSSNYYLIMNFSCGYDETDDANDLLNEIFITKIQPIDNSDFKLFAKLADLSNRKGKTVK